MSAPVSDRVLSLSMPCDLSCLERAGEQLRRLDLPGDADSRANLQLVVWELLTNAVIHSGGLPSEAVGLEVGVVPDAVSIRVSDPGPGFAPALRAAATDATSGRGLLIVSRLSRAWGVDRSLPSSVWCEMPLARASIVRGREAAPSSALPVAR